MKQEYGRTTITVPSELKARMKKARALVNWSSVACDAFEKKLSELGPIEEVTSIDVAVARMKSVNAMGSEFGEGVLETGKESGKRWALNFATPNQLQRMADFRIQIPDAQWPAYMSSRDGYMELGKCIDPQPDRFLGAGPAAIEPGPFQKDPWNDSSGRRGRNRRPRMSKRPNGELGIWPLILDHRPEHPRFFLGFAEGALEVWNQIKDQF